jgi:hypothetical protein
MNNSASTKKLLLVGIACAFAYAQFGPAGLIVVGVIGLAMSK